MSLLCFSNTHDMTRHAPLCHHILGNMQMLAGRVLQASHKISDSHYIIMNVTHLVKLEAIHIHEL